MIPELRRLFRRELSTLRAQVLAYPDDAALWSTQAAIHNPGGTLALHLCGNLQHFVGGLLGGSGYVRDRDAEFAQEDATRAELAELAETTRQVVDRTLATLDEARLADEFPMKFPGGPLSTGMFLMHLTSHLSYHLGQLDYHRRAASANAPTVPALDFPGLYESLE